MERRRAKHFLEINDFTFTLTWNKAQGMRGIQK